MKVMQKAIAKGNPSEIKRIIGQCVDEMTLDPEECQGTINKQRRRDPLRRCHISW